MLEPSQFSFALQQQLKQPFKFGPGVDPDSDWSKWKCLYPNYINSKKKISEGRRIAVSKAADDPTAEEMGMICEHFRLPFVVECKKAYPRDWLIPGRLRVLLKDENGYILNQEIPTKKVLMARMGELIPQLKSRHLPQASSTNQHAASSKSKKKKR